MATGWSDLSPLGQAGIISQGFGTIGGMVGSYYAAKSEQNKTRSLALQYQHKKDMALFNERMKESQAQHIMRSFNKQYQILSLKQGRKKSTARASFAARGIQMGVGSTKDAFVSSEILYLLTVIGRVRFIQIFIGTPSCPMPIFGSGVITLRAEKSTRFPIRLPRTRPSLDFKRSVNALIGRPERCCENGTPEILLFTSVATLY